MNLDQISVRHSEDFEVQLPGAPATGYTWQLVSYPAQIQPLSSAYDQQVEGPPAVGDPGTQRFRFRALEPGSYDVAFVLQRPWESVPLQARTIHVHVAP
jgi:predicted secreted protein